MTDTVEAGESRSCFQPGRVWSLFDVLKVNAGFFVTLNDMLRTLEESAKATSDDIPWEQMDALVAEVVRVLGEWSGELSLPVSQRVLKDLSSAKNLQQLWTAVAQFRRTTTAELDSHTFLVLRADLAPLYDEIEPFGKAVATAFPNSAEDIESAAKCLALEQPTACIFHLMRAMEAGVGALCTRVGISNPDREWGKLLSDLHKAIEKMPAGKERNQWSEAHANLYHVKQAWRNETMHPKQTYTIEQANEVFRATRTFMSQLVFLV